MRRYFALFIIHFVLYIKYAFPLWTDLIEEPRNGFENSYLATIEYIISPFVFIVAYITTGAKIAPAHKFAVAVVLSLIPLLILVSGYLLGAFEDIESNFTFGLPTVGAVLGFVFGIYVAWKTRDDE